MEIPIPPSCAKRACRAGIPADVLESQIEAILEAMGHTVVERRHELDPILMPGVQESSAISQTAARCWVWPPATLR